MLTVLLGVAHVVDEQDLVAVAAPGAPPVLEPPGVPSFLRDGERVELRLVERRPLQHRAAARVRRRGNTRRSRLRPVPGSRVHGDGGGQRGGGGGRGAREDERGARGCSAADSHCQREDFEPGGDALVLGKQAAVRLTGNVA